MRGKFIQLCQFFVVQSKNGHSVSPEGRPEHHDNQNRQHGYQTNFLPGRTTEATEASD